MKVEIGADGFFVNAAPFKVQCLTFNKVCMVLSFQTFQPFRKKINSVFNLKLA